MAIEDLIIRQLQGRTTVAEDNAIGEWLRGSSANETHYSRTARLWSLVAEASPIPDGAVAVPVEEVIARAENIELAETRHWDPERCFAYPTTSSDSLFPSRWIPTFAMGAVAASVLYLLVAFGLPGVPGGQAAEDTFQTISTTSDAGVTLTLYDGTAVRLAPSSELRVVQTGMSPIVELRGRAYFGVVPDSTRTFVVRTPFGDATALGTRFEVRTDSDELEVLVVQGSVRVATAGGAVELGQGMMSRTVGGGQHLAAGLADMHSRLEWLGQTLVFRATPLTEVIDEIESRYDVEVELATATLGELEVTAVFTERPVEDVIYVVCSIVGARCVQEEGKFRIGVDDGSLRLLHSGTAQLPD